MSGLPFDAFDMCDAVGVRERRGWERRAPRKVQPDETEEQRVNLKPDWRMNLIVIIGFVIIFWQAIAWGMEVAAQ